MKRWLDWRRLTVYVHRWLGIAGGVLFVAWFVSGVVMMYARMPGLAHEERLARAPALDLAGVTLTPLEAARAAGLVPDGRAPAELRRPADGNTASRSAGTRVDRVRIGMRGDRTVYRLGASRRSEKIVFADTGEVFTRVGRADGRGARPPLRPGIRRPVPLRRLPHRARSVDAAGPRAVADASLRPRRCGRHAAVRVRRSPATWCSARPGASASGDTWDRSPTGSTSRRFASTDRSGWKSSSGRRSSAA